ncbi:hypothetical protein J3E68DRAFT_429520 [Trichoderma sp. SZMC 28012]
MASEFAAHISGHRHEYALRQVVIKAAMDLNDRGKVTEAVANFRPHRLTDSLDYEWREFSISSYSGNSDGASTDLKSRHCSLDHG